nr:hypothetical protein [Tanacetum cinerariifolium]
MPEIPIPPAVASPPSFRTRRKSIARKHVHKPKPKIPTLDLDSPTQAFLKFIVDEDSDDVDSVNEVWSAVVGWEILSTPLGDINALYLVQYYEQHHAVGSGLLFGEIFKFYLILKQGERDLLFGKINIYRRFEVGDVTYPLSVELMKKMLMQKLEIDSKFVRNDLTTADQLIQFIKNQIVAAQASSV